MSNHLIDKDQKPVIGITIGDPNGIGMEVILKTLVDNRMHQICTPVIYGSSKIISFYRKTLNIAEFNYNSVKNAEGILHKKLNVINCWEDEVKLEPGLNTEAGGKYAFLSLEHATQDLLDNKIDALVTAPINKENIQKSGFKFAGHTEYLADKCKATGHLMFMVSEGLKVAVVTGHVALKDIPAGLSPEKIIQKLNLMNQSLKEDFGIVKPRIAVLGLNPHASDNGIMGTEERDIIIPAINKAKEAGLFVYGPYAADGFFASTVIKEFDAVLAMYHDQGLVPFKALAFDSGVNYTAGLPIVRTSPDHGTAYDIAGKNLANEGSFRHAVYTAIDILAKRAEYKELNANPLQSNISKLSRDH